MYKCTMSLFCVESREQCLAINFNKNKIIIFINFNKNDDPKVFKLKLRIIV